MISALRAARVKMGRNLCRIMKIVMMAIAMMMMTIMNIQVELNKGYEKGGVQLFKMWKKFSLVQRRPIY